MYRWAVALFTVCCVVCVGGAALGEGGFYPTAAGALALALLAGYVITAPSGDPGGVSGRARALFCGGLLAVAVAVVVVYRPPREPMTLAEIREALYAGVVFTESGRPYRIAAIALAVALAAFLLGTLSLPRAPRGGFLTAGPAMLAVVGVAAVFHRVVPLPTLPLLFGGPVRFALSLAAGFAGAVLLLLRAARRRGFPVGVAGVLLAAGFGAVALRLPGLLETAEALTPAIPQETVPPDAFLQPGVEISVAVMTRPPQEPEPLWAGFEVTLQAALLLAGPLLIVAGALGLPRRTSPEEPVES